MCKQPPPAPTARAVGPCATLRQTNRTPRHWKLGWFGWLFRFNGPLRQYFSLYRAVSQRGRRLAGWLFGFNGPLRQYFSLYRAASQREGERGEQIVESKNVQTTPTRTYCKHSRPLPYYHPNCRTPLHWKFTQNLRTTRPPREGEEKRKDLREKKCQNVPPTRTYCTRNRPLPYYNPN